MEDTKKRKSDPNATNANKGPIFELTSDLEVPGADRGKIIDLIHVRHSQSQPKSGDEPAPAHDPTADGQTAPITTPGDSRPAAEPDVAETGNPPIDAIAPDPIEIETTESLHQNETDDALKLDTASDVTSDTSGSMHTTSNPDLETDLGFDLDLNLDGIDMDEPAISRANSATDEPEEELELCSDIIDTDELDTHVDELIELTDFVDPDDSNSAETAPPFTLPIETEEAAIELTDIVDPAEARDLAQRPEDDDDIIELTDIVGPSELYASADGPRERALDEAEEGDDDAIIELTEIVNAAERIDKTPSDSADPELLDEEPIELTDIVIAEMDTDTQSIAAIDSIEDPERPMESADSEISGFEITPADDEVQVDPAVEAVDTPMGGDTAATISNMFDGDEDQVIRLDSVLSHIREHERRMTDDITEEIAEKMAATAMATGQADGGMVDGMTSEDTDQVVAMPVDLTANSLQKAIEQVIRTQYARTIEDMIAATVERVVTREMESIRNSLMSDE